jgi:hypothetical protein
MTKSDISQARRALPLLTVFLLLGCAAPTATPTAALPTEPPVTETAAAPETTPVRTPTPQGEATIPTETAAITQTPVPTATFTPPDLASLPVTLHDEQLDPWDRGNTSADGRYTVFTALPEQLGTSDTASNWYVYLRDNSDGTVRIVSANEEGEPGNFWNTPAVISANGSTVAFWSYSTNLVDLGNDCEHADTMNSGCELGHVYVVNVFTGELQHIEVGAGYGLGMVDDIDLSADGRFLAFSTLGAVTRSGAWLLDRATGEFTQISPQGMSVDLADDGSVLAYVATDDEEVPYDGNMSEDLFLYDVTTGERTWSASAQRGGAILWTTQRLCVLRRGWRRRLRHDAGWSLHYLHLDAGGAGCRPVHAVRDRRLSAGETGVPARLFLRRADRRAGADQRIERGHTRQPAEQRRNGLTRWAVRGVYLQR